MPSKNPRQRLEDIASNIKAIEEFCDGYDLDSFRKDKRTVYAVTRALEIVSEASRRLPESLRLRYPNIDWTAIAASGNVFRHEYDAVDEAMLWTTVTRHLTSLRDAVLEQLTQHEPPSISD